MHTFRPSGPQVLLHLFAGFVIWLGCQMLSLVSQWISAPIPALLVSAAVQIGGTYFFLRLYCVKVLRIDLEECRINKRLPQPAWVLCAVLLPVLVSVSFLLFVPGTISSNQLEPGQLTVSLASAVLATCITASVTEELVFRGFVMHVVEARFGRGCAVLLPSILFAAFHLVGAELHFPDVLQLLLAGTSVGVLFSLDLLSKRVHLVQRAGTRPLEPGHFR